MLARINICGEGTGGEVSCVLARSWVKYSKISCNQTRLTSLCYSLNVFIHFRVYGQDIITHLLINIHILTIERVRLQHLCKT